MAMPPSMDHALSAMTSSSAANALVSELTRLKRLRFLAVGESAGYYYRA